MHKPTEEEIEAAAMRMGDARRSLKADTAKATQAVRNFAVKPATLLSISALAGVAGYLLFRPTPAKRVRPAHEAQVPQAASTGLIGLVVALASRYAIQRIPRIGFDLIEEAIKRRGKVSAATASSATLH
ncbi:MAG: hypothetical protein ABI630_02500 [Betaproteobacteria bacterium]